MTGLTHFIRYFPKLIHDAESTLRNRNLEAKPIKDIPPFINPERLLHCLQGTVFTLYP
jgi:hypothetical protein